VAPERHRHPSIAPERSPSDRSSRATARGAVDRHLDPRRPGAEHIDAPHGRRREMRDERGARTRAITSWTRRQCCATGASCRQSAPMTKAPARRAPRCRPPASAVRADRPAVRAVHVGAEPRCPEAVMCRPSQAPTPRHPRRPDPVDTRARSPAGEEAVCSSRAVEIGSRGVDFGRRCRFRQRLPGGCRVAASSPDAGRVP
jgi:hypothetical protein